MQAILQEKEIREAIQAIRAQRTEKLRSLYERLVALVKEEEDNAEDYAKYRETASDTYAADGITEIDADAVVSQGSDPGAYVSAWVWVAAEDAGVEFDKEGTDENEEQKEGEQEGP
jgi:hypothetical protein